MYCINNSIIYHGSLCVLQNQALASKVSQVSFLIYKIKATTTSLRHILLTPCSHNAHKYATYLLMLRRENCSVQKDGFKIVEKLLQI